MRFKKDTNPKKLSASGVWGFRPLSGLSHLSESCFVQTYETTHWQRFCHPARVLQVTQTSTSLPMKAHCWTSFEGPYISLTPPPKFLMCTVCSPRPSTIFILRVLDVSTVALGKCQFHCRRAWKWILSGAKWALLDAFSIS